MPKEARKLSPALFALIIVFFFLPFVSVTCGDTKAATLNGIQLVTGTTIDQPPGFGQKSSAREIGAEPTAIAAIALAVIGLAFSSSKGSRGTAVAAIVGVAGALSLLFLKARIDGEIQKQGTGLLQTDYEIGFWLALLGFILAAGLNAYYYLKERDVGQIVTPPPDQDHST